MQVRLCWHIIEAFLLPAFAQMVEEAAAQHLSKIIVGSLQVPSQITRTVCSGNV